MFVPPYIMVQGTTSDAGKSTLVTALGRFYRQQGIRVVPFKPQNMALNSAVTVDGGEIGRAQAVQALACGLPPHSDMNPVLLKPSSDQRAQVIIHGQVLRNQSAAEYHDYKRYAMDAVLDSWQRLTAAYQTVVVEGAGSPAEINLRQGDIANMGFAEAVNCPVILIADIDRGGVFAHLVGTLALLSPSERQRVIGFVINRFRGDFALLQSGLDWLEAETGKPVLAVLPYLHDLYLEAEDALTTHQAEQADASRLQVVVPHLPGFSNHTDFDALQLHPQVEVTFAKSPQSLAGADLIVLPGSKTVQRDLHHLRQQGWEPFIRRHLRYGGKVLGICGGMQMLGQAIHDPQALEGEGGSMAGLGLLAFETTLHANKQLKRVRGRLSFDQAPLSGYEIHMGISSGSAMQNPLIYDLRSLGEMDEAVSGVDGAISDDGQVAATYVHGLFDDADACAAMLRWAGLSQVERIDYAALRENGIEQLARVWAEQLNREKWEQALAQFAW